MNQNPINLGDPNTMRLLGYGIAAVVGLLFVWWFVRRISGRRKPKSVGSSFAAIRVADLGTAGPPATGPQFSCFGAPMRLALIAIARAGREGLLPSDEAIGDLLDRAVPGMGRVFRSHQPTIHRWPGQLSAGGFNSAFVRECKLPQEGAGTPWSAVAGPIVDGDDRYFIGILCRAAQANNLKHTTLSKETQWLETLKVGEV